MTIDHPVRRVLARVCSADTMSRVVDPTLADMRFERGRPTWRGYLSLMRALTLHAAHSWPGSLSRLWSDDDHALPRAAVTGAIAVLVLSAPFVWIPLREDRLLSPWRSALLLAPQALALTLPASLLVAIPAAYRRAARPGRIMVRGLALSAVCAIATFVVINRIVPDTNQMWREEVSAHFGRPVHLDRGPNELTLPELRERIEGSRVFPGEVRVARSLEYTYHMRLMLGMIAVPLGIFAVAIALSIRGRIRSVLAGAGSMIGYAAVLFPLEGAWLKLMNRFEALPPALGVWTPAIALLIVASIALRHAMRRAPTASA